MFQRIDHIALHVSNLDKSLAFYQENFDFREYANTTTPSGMKIVYLKLGDTILELSDFSEGNMIGFHFCLTTDDFDQAVNHLVAKQVAIEMPPHPTAARIATEEGWLRALFIGPDGEKIEIRGKSLRSD